MQINWLLDYIKSYLRNRKYARSLLANFASYGFRAHTPFFMPFQKDDRIEMIVESPGEMKLLFIHYSDAFNENISLEMLKEFRTKCEAYESVYDYSAYESSYLFIVNNKNVLDEEIDEWIIHTQNRVSISEFKARF
jgi:hypothetical protein